MYVLARVSKENFRGIMYCLPKKDKVKCSHCGNKDVHWQNVYSSHDCYSYVDHYCKHHRVHWKCKWEQCGYDIEYCSSLPTGVIVNTVYGNLWNPPINCENVCDAHSDFIVKTLGEIDYFSEYTCTGLVKVGSNLYKFPSTCFQAIRSPRFPRKGESVEVTMKRVNGEFIVLCIISNN